MCTVESRCFEPPREMKILLQKSDSSRYRGAKLQKLAKQGKRRLVQIIGRFEKLRVRELGFHRTYIDVTVISGYLMLILYN